MYRCKLILKSKLGFAGLSFLLMLAFVMPFNDKWNWLTEPMVVLFYCPFLISLGAGAVLSKRFSKICIFSGKISYPLYMTHYAAIWMFLNYYTKYQPGTMTLSFIIIAGTIIMILFAYLVMKFYDIPLRKYLTAKRKAI